MSDKTRIEWTDATWNPVTGCSVVSAGCRRCYAMRLAGTRLKHHPSRQGLTTDTQAGPVWTGEVRLNPGWMAQPLAWGRPRRIFVCAHGDLFHESVPDEWIDQVFAVMAMAPRHTFQVLTKRADRMHRYITAPWRLEAIVASMPKVWPHEGSWVWPDEVAPRNVWLGVSVENQEAAEARIPALLATPAHVRWISAEPLLGPLDFSKLVTDDLDPRQRFNWLEVLDWVVVGGESGPGARPMKVQWARELRDQCAAVSLPFLFKQWGAWRPAGFDGSRPAAGRLLDGVLHDAYPQG